MKRNEILRRVKELGLQEVVKKAFKRNYTNVSSESLLEIIQSNEKPKTEKPIAKCNNAKVNKLIEFLDKRHILLRSEIEELKKL